MVINWLEIQLFCGTILPPLIEMFFKNVHKRVKTIIVFGFALVTVAIQMGVNGQWGMPELALPWWQIGINFISLLYISITSFKGFWKQFFPNDTPPDIGVPIKEDVNYKTLT